MRNLIILVFVSMMLLLGPAGVVGAEEFETPGNRDVSDILPKEMVSGPHYRVQDEVVSYGFMHHFRVDSDFGVFEVIGDGALRKLIKEIRAIAALQETKKTDAYLDAVKEAGKSPIKFGENLVTNPVDTVTGVPKGVFKVFDNAYRGITGPKDPSADSWEKQMLGVAASKRRYAYELGVDVYSSNAVLQKELNSVGWASAAGSLTVSAALAPLGGAAMVFKGSQMAEQMNQALRDEPASRLRKINAEKLTAMGISKEVADEFLDHHAFTPRHDTIIVGNLESLGGATGRGTFLQAAVLAGSEGGANFFQNMAETIRSYHETVSPIREITMLSGFVFARAANGSVLMPFPLDHGVWSERADRVVRNLVASHNASGSAGRLELWVTGTVTPLARKQLELLGIEVVENVDEVIEFMD